MKTYVDNKKRVSAIIRIPNFKADTFGMDLREVLQAKLTIHEALEDKNIPIMVKQRLNIIKTKIFTNMENAASVLT